MILAGAAGALIGGAVGFVVSRFSSRFNGAACPLMCNPRIAVPYFAVMGMILASQFGQ